MINYQTFYRLMRGISSQQPLPTLIFNPASSIGMATQGIATLLDDREITSTRDNVQCLVDQINCPVNTNHYATLTKIADAYAGKILNTFNVLGFIKSSVESIKTKIDAQVEIAAASSEIITQANLFSSDVYQSEFVSMPWDDIQNFGTASYIVNQLQNGLGLFQDKKTTDVVFDETTLTIVNNISTKYFVDNKATVPSLSTIQIDALKQYCSDHTSMGTDKLQTIIPVLFSQNSLTQWLENAFRRVNKGTASDVLDAITDIRTMNGVLSVAESNKCYEAIGLTDTQVTSFNKNVQHIINTLCLEYIFVSSKRNKNKDVLIFGVNLVNPDAIPGFTKEGFGLVDISKFLKARKIQVVDRAGYKTSDVIEAIKNVRRDLQRDGEALNRMANVELRRINKDAFVKHVGDFMEQLSHTPTVSNMKSYIDHMANDINSLNGSVESGIYGVIINGEYGNTFIQQMYERLGKSYVNALSNIQQPDDTHLAEAEVSEIVDVICTHMLTQLIEDVQ